MKKVEIKCIVAKELMDKNLLDSCNFDAKDDQSSLRFQLEIKKLEVQERIELERLKIEAEIELEKLKLQRENRSQNSKNSSSLSAAFDAGRYIKLV